MKQKLKTNGFTRADLLVTIVTLVALTYLIVQFIFISQQRRPMRHRVMKISCSNNLRQVGLAFRIWAADNGEKFPMQVSVTNGGSMELAGKGSTYSVFIVMTNILNTPKILFCPWDNNRQRFMADVFASSNPQNQGGSEFFFSPSNNISYFVGLDANSGKPQQILSGDDHFQVAGKTPTPGLFLLSTNALIKWKSGRHGDEQANIVFADGSLLSVTNSGFRAVLAKTGIATNRLALP